MPNHLHGIIGLNHIHENEEAGFTPTLIDEPNKIGPSRVRAGVNPAPTLGNIVGAYKSLVSSSCLDVLSKNDPDIILGKMWQRSYYEHIIRNEQSYYKIAEYIINNPAKWGADKFYR